MERRLTAILASDVVAYSRLMGADEEGTVATLKKYRDCFDKLVRQHGGRVHKDPRAPFRARGMPKTLIDRIMKGLEIAGYEVPPETAGH